MSCEGKAKRVAILGATGLVGREITRVLEQRRFPVSTFLPLASERSAGTKVEFGGESYTVEAVNDRSFQDIDIALFSAGGSTSKRWAPIAVSAGATVVDNSSAWRMDPTVPLVVPEINPEDIKLNRGIIANPNCSTIQAVVALYPLHKKAGLRYISVSTYQSVSGTGAKALSTLVSGSREILEGCKPQDGIVYPYPIAFEMLPHIG